MCELHNFDLLWISNTACCTECCTTCRCYGVSTCATKYNKTAMKQLILLYIADVLQLCEPLQRNASSLRVCSASFCSLINSLSSKRRESTESFQLFLLVFYCILLHMCKPHRRSFHLTDHETFERC